MRRTSCNLVSSPPLPSTKWSALHPPDFSHPDASCPQATLRLDAIVFGHTMQRGSPQLPSPPTSTPTSVSSTDVCRHRKTGLLSGEEVVLSSSTSQSLLSRTPSFLQSIAPLSHSTPLHLTPPLHCTALHYTDGAQSRRRDRLSRGSLHECSIRIRILIRSRTHTSPAGLQHSTCLQSVQRTTSPSSIQQEAFLRFRQVVDMPDTCLNIPPYITY
ncbi:hypothetical protein TcWFU_008851 [Taenia crassiceps]|uniref:Uncharacterized protein n=1 Tax=Taenia crassiceps TaxID=6207 RepID=A0ABR4Q7L1_9CEST